MQTQATQPTETEDKLPAGGNMPTPTQTQTNDNVPEYRRKLRAGRQAAWDSLTPDEQQQVYADRDRRRAACAVRREAKRAARLAIGELAISGDKIEEIAAKTGLSLASLYHRRLYWGVPISGRRGFRRLFSWVADADVAALDALAVDMQTDRGRALEALLRAVLIDQAYVARRTLGVVRKDVA